jgi:chromosome partitioning protein
MAIANQKGGVGKTTTAINLAMALRTLGRKILLIDLDPQGNASTGLGLKNRERTIYHVLSGKIGCREAVQVAHNFDIVPSAVELAAFEVESASLNVWQHTLSNKFAPMRPMYDYILIDCPPALGSLTINALSWANSVLIPMQCEFFAMEGLGHLIKTIRLVRGKLNSSLRIGGVLLTMYDKRSKLNAQVADDVRNNLGDAAYQTIIPRNVKLSEASSHGCPIMSYDARCSGAGAYMALAEEILSRDSEGSWSKKN